MTYFQAVQNATLISTRTEAGELQSRARRPSASINSNSSPSQLFNHHVNYPTAWNEAVVCLRFPFIEVQEKCGIAALGSEGLPGFKLIFHEVSRGPGWGCLREAWIRFSVLGSNSVPAYGIPCKLDLVSPVWPNVHSLKWESSGGT